MGAEVITGIDEIAGLLPGAQGIAYTGPGTAEKPIWRRWIGWV